VPDMRNEDELGGVNEGLPTELDCNLAMIAHLLYVLPIVGILGALLIWQWRREESRFLDYQAKQAAAFQGAVLGVMVVVGIVVAVFGHVPVVGALFRIGLWLTVILIGLGGLALALNAAVRVRLGANYKYPVVSGWVGE